MTEEELKRLCAAEIDETLWCLARWCAVIAIGGFVCWWVVV